MFKKVLIAEDYESANLSVQRVLEDLKIEDVDHVYYCDDALAKIKKSLRDGNPYDLLITDLSFEEDHYVQNIKSGKELLQAAKAEQSNLKVIVFSGESKSGIIDSLFTDFQIDGYVRKARYDSKELSQAIKTVYKDEKHLALDVQQSVKKMNTYEITKYDTQIISLLANGTFLKDIPAVLKLKNISPSSLSAVEKRISLLKTSLGVKSNEHLIAFCKDLGII
jgi:two-component system capsular synthesis response regulator RcsB